MRRSGWYRQCPECGSNLDPGEICDCQNKHPPEAGVDAAQFSKDGPKLDQNPPKNFGI